MLIIIFGLQGAGKTYVGKVLKSLTEFHFYDGDSDLPESMVRALREKKRITMAMRTEFFATIFASIRSLLQSKKNIIVAQTFVKERFRNEALNTFPEAKFILVKAQPKIRRKRLLERDHLNLTSLYEKRMAARFDKPIILHEVIINNEDGQSHLIPQLNAIKQKLSL
jgi:gluconate kinase